MQNLIPLLTIALLSLFPASAAIVPSQLKEMRDAAPEHLHLTVTKVEKEEVEKDGKHSFHITVHAKVTGAPRSRTGLDAGKTILIKYQVPNHEKTQQDGDWPSIVREGKSYQAFLRLNFAKGHYDPAASSGSFVLLAKADS